MPSDPVILEYYIPLPDGPPAPWWVAPIMLLVYASPFLGWYAQQLWVHSMSLIPQPIPPAHVVAVYFFETEVRPIDAAFGVAKEQSAYIFAEQPGPRTDELLEQNAVKVGAVDVQSVRRHGGQPIFTTDSAVLIRRYHGRPWKRGEFTLAFPEANFDDDIAQLLNSVLGEPHHSAWVSRLKLLDLQASDEYLTRSFPGPQFGVEGLRQQLACYDRPLFCGPVKPSVGCSPEEFAELAYRAWIGGADIVKDDELLGDPAYCPLEKRLPLVLDARNRAQDQTGEPKLFVAHVSGQRIERNVEAAARAGADGFMVCPFFVGWQWLPKLTEYGRLIFCHNAGLTITSRVNDWGVGFPLWCKISRWLGADVVIMPSPAGSFVMSPEECSQATIRCLGPSPFKHSFPAYAGSKTAGHLPVFRDLVGSSDFMFIVGAALFEHPLGAEAGARALRQGWEAVAHRVSLIEYAKEHPELHAALAQTGFHVWRNWDTDMVRPWREG